MTDIRYTYVVIYLASSIQTKQARFCLSYYKESHKILGQTFGMCVLQDFEAITPNLLARTIETVEGGGLVVIMLKTMKSLRQLYSMTMARSLHASVSCVLSDMQCRMFTRDIARRHMTLSSLASTSVSFSLSARATTALC